MNRCTLGLLALSACDGTPFDKQLDELESAVDRNPGPVAEHLIDLHALKAKVDLLDELDVNGDGRFDKLDVTRIKEALDDDAENDDVVSLAELEVGLASVDEPGADGLACWDTNGNGMEDESENTNGDNAWDALDCQVVGPPGEQGLPGGPGPQGPGGGNCWDGLDCALDGDPDCTPNDCLPDLTGYATDAELASLDAEVGAIQADYLTSSDLAPYATSAALSDVSGRVADIEADYLTSSDLAPYATSAALSGLSGRVTTIENDYLVSGDLTPYATIVALNAVDADVTTVETSLAEAGLDTSPDRQELADLLADVFVQGGNFFFDGVDVVFEGGNVHIRNGTGADSNLLTADGQTYVGDGKGNLIIGWNAPIGVDPRVDSGSHNIIVGDDHSWAGLGGMLLGKSHTTGYSGGEGQALIGGVGNGIGSGDGSVVIGGESNNVSSLLGVHIGGEGSHLTESSEGFGSHAVGLGSLSSWEAFGTVGDGEVANADHTVWLEGVDFNSSPAKKPGYAP